MSPLASNRIVSKPWGRFDPPIFLGRLPRAKIGEVWLDDHGSDTLAKFLFTSERLSIQVHPDDHQARALGSEKGKDECWLILEAEPDAHYGIGFKRPITRAELQRSLQDGSVVDLMDWKEAHVGDFIYNPAGTVHALGPGLTVLEVQQNSDVTLRLFDYFSPRELHVQAAMKVARLGPHAHPADTCINFRSTTVLVDGPFFGLAYCAGTLPDLSARARDVQLIAWKSRVSLGGRGEVPPGSSISLPSLNDLRILQGQKFFLVWST